MNNDMSLTSNSLFSRTRPASTLASPSTSSSLSLPPSLALPSLPSAAAAASSEELSELSTE